ncbi:MAG: YbaK/EbsC family protein [Candidatus Gracilibacteria bacterium]|nr:YbaK/EbsC family protein [Candidatus Gracilibacteria bacterium]
MTKLYNNIMDILKNNNVIFKEYSHGPILNYEDALREQQIHNWDGVESKNVFMTNKNGKYYIFVTFQGQKVDFKLLKDILGEKLSMCNEEEVRDIINCVPGCIAPFGFSYDILTIIDKRVFGLGKYLFSPGVVDKTIGMNSMDLQKIFNNTKNIIFIN